MTCYALEGISPVVDTSAYVHPSAVLIGDVIVGAGCYVGPCASLRGDFGRIELRRGANVQDNCVLHSFPDCDTVVEDNGHIGHGAVLHGCVVRHDALVGMNAVVMDGVEVGAQTIVAACAFVAAGTRLPPRSLVAGTPATVRRALRDDELQRKLEGTIAYQRLAERCLAGLSEVSPEARVTPDRRRSGHAAVRAPSASD